MALDWAIKLFRCVDNKFSNIVCGLVCTVDEASGKSCGGAPLEVPATADPGQRITLRTCAATSSSDADAASPPRLFRDSGRRSALNRAAREGGMALTQFCTAPSNPNAVLFGVSLRCFNGEHLLLCSSCSRY